MKNLHLGKKIFHKQFGIGVISEVFKNNDGEDVVIRIKFNKGEKRILLKYAQLFEPTEAQLKQQNIDRRDL